MGAWRDTGAEGTGSGGEAQQIETLLTRLAARTRRYDFTVWFWGDAIAFDGLLDAAELAADGTASEFCLRFFDRWLTAPAAWTDYLTPGDALLRLQAATGRADLLDGALRLARWYAEQTPRGPNGLHYFRPDLPQFRTTVLVDSMYHVPPFLARLTRLTGEARYAEFGWEMWRTHAEVLASDRGPLLCHNYDVGSGRHRGYGWGRGNGWALLGLVDLLELLPDDHRYRKSALTHFRQLGGEVLALQDESGFWRTLLADREAYLESSTAGFFGAAFTKGVRLGLLPHEFGIAAEKAWRALLSRIDAEGGFYGVSGVTWASNAPVEELSLYKSMPTEVNVWGQGCALRFAGERLRMQARRGTESRVE
jgi:unsaturated rhamnogalacturonyl hydrolase